jgi:hypothetical protein
MKVLSIRILRRKSYFVVEGIMGLGVVKKILHFSQKKLSILACDPIC